MNQTVEDINHLFFECPFSTVCWQKLGFTWDLNLDIHSRLQEGNHNLNIPYFMEIFIIAAWELWNVRNGKKFEGQPVSIQLWILRFKAQINLQIHRVRVEHRHYVVQWLSYPTPSLSSCKYFSNTSVQCSFYFNAFAHSPISKKRAEINSL